MAINNNNNKNNTASYLASYNKKIDQLYADTPMTIYIYCSDLIKMSLKWLAVELFVIKPLNLCELSGW